MSNRFSDTLFQLIHSLEKSEKRHFKLYIKRSSTKEDLKIVQLFDALDKLNDYDEKALLKKLPGIEKPQLSNLKTHLYKQILASLRLLKSADSIDLQLNEMFDYAHILYKKGLFQQSLRLIDRAKDMAKANQKFNFLALALGLDERDEVIAILGLGSSLRVMGRAQESLQTLSALAHTNNAAFLFHALALYDSTQYEPLARQLLARLLQVLVERQDDDVMPFRAPLERYIRNLATPGDGDRP